VTPAPGRESLDSFLMVIGKMASLVDNPALPIRKAGGGNESNPIPLPDFCAREERQKRSHPAAHGINLPI